MIPLHPRPTARPLALAAALSLLLILPAGAAVKIGTPAGEILTGTNGADQITGDAGNDALRGLAGDDTYHFADGWGSDTLEEKRAYRVGDKKVPGGSDTLSFRDFANGYVVVFLIPEWRGLNPGFNRALGSDGGVVDLGGSAVENVVGTALPDHFTGGGADNRFATGGGAQGALFDFGGYDDGPEGYPELPPSDDAYAGAAANTGDVYVADWGGAADVLDLRPLRRDDVVLARVDLDGDADKESLQVVTGTGDGQVLVFGQFGAYKEYPDVLGQDGQIETLRFADRTVTFGGTASAGGDQHGESLLGVAETKRQRELAKRAPALADAARRQAPDLTNPSELLADRGR